MEFDPRAVTVVERDTVIEGDLSCYALRLLGKVTGDVTAVRFADIESGAEVGGELKCGSLRISKQAKIGKFTLLSEGK